MPASPLAPACLTAPQLCPPISRPPTSPPLQCRLQTGTTDRYHMYAGPLDCLRQTVRAEGLRGLMRGLGGTMAREMPGNAVCEPCLGWDCCLLPMAAGLLAVCFCRMSLASVHAQRLSTLPPSPPTTTTPPPSCKCRLWHLPPAAPLAAREAARGRTQPAGQLFVVAAPGRRLLCHCMRRAGRWAHPQPPRPAASPTHAFTQQRCTSADTCRRCVVPAAGTSTRARTLVHLLNPRIVCPY